MTQRLSFKSGSTFKATMAYAPTAGLAPPTLAGVTITSQVRTKEGKLIGTMTAAITGDASFTLTADTSTWPSDIEAEWDIKMSHATYGVFYTETVILVLQGKVTA